MVVLFVEKHWSVAAVAERFQAWRQDGAQAARQVLSRGRGGAALPLEPSEALSERHAGGVGQRAVSAR